MLLAYLMSEELKAYNVAAVSLTPGWLRSEAMLDGYGVTEEDWQDALESNPDFAKSETPCYGDKYFRCLSRGSVFAYL